MSSKFTQIKFTLHKLTKKRNILGLLVFVLLILDVLTGLFFADNQNDKNKTSLDKKALLKSLEKCKTSSNQVQCWANLISSTLETKGLDSAFVLYGELYAKESAFAASCHSFAHQLGEAGYKEYSQGKDFGLTSKTSYCGYGFYHGFMEDLLLATKDPKKASDFCDFVGKKLAGQTNDAKGACYHGIGHGSVDGGDPRDWGDPQAVVEPGLSLCEQISSNKDQLYRCVTGAYNALEILSADSKYRLEGFREDTFGFCAEQITTYKEACYTNMLPAVMGNLGSDFPKIAKVIEAIAEENDSYSIRSWVISGLFHEYYRVNLGKSDFADSGVQICRSLQPRSHLPCIEGLSGGLMKYGEPEKEYVKTLEFCANKILNSEESNTCYQRTLTTLDIWYAPAKVKMICGLVPKEYNRYCIR